MKLGIDIGSTSLKGVLLDDNGAVVFKKYLRHHAAILPVLLDFLHDVEPIAQQNPVAVMFTGSIGMGISERMDFPFSQEVISSIKFVQQNFPEVKTFIDIGGEDSKMIFFSSNRQPDIRMNGSCAGGTGAFIDQMATLLGIPIEEMNSYAEKAETVYPIASRCGVFSKTDIQNLVARNVSKPDIVASIFHAVALQVISSLSRGYDVVPKLFFCGAPCAYLPELKKAFLHIIQLDDLEVVATENPELVPAHGTALAIPDDAKTSTIADIILKIKQLENVQVNFENHSLQPLFNSEADFLSWKQTKTDTNVAKINIAQNAGDDYFLGIDSGSTTTKIVITNQNDEIVFDYYAKNSGDALATFTAGIRQFQELLAKNGRSARFISSAVTGYGENLLKIAYNLHHGIVETMAHTIAAKHIAPNVSFILDIGGQDMKAIFLDNGAIRNIEINEACSSGCGSFIDGFAGMLGMAVGDFAQLACRAKQPADLGTRCTVFMNSKVKQRLREGAAVEDVAAGLSYSVIKNCLFKVLKLKTISELGEMIVVQGGTFKNPSVLRCLELLTDKKVTVSNIPELMGAYGAALYAHQCWKNHQQDDFSISVNDLLQLKAFDSKNLQCKGCENRCNIKKILFSNQKQYFSGNKCDKIYSNLDTQEEKGANFHDIKYQQLFAREAKLTNPRFTMGIPRGLIFYEDYPFWHTLLTECNIQPLLSGVATVAQYEKGIKTIMADNICFPAKLMHGHLMYLIKKNVDRILYPYIIYERKVDAKTANSYNCPIVSGYSDVLKSAIETEEVYNIPLDSPVLNFNNPTLLQKSLTDYLTQFGIEKSTIRRAVSRALAVQQDWERALYQQVTELYEQALAKQQPVVLLAGRPYHIDPLIQHKISEAIANFGVTVINEDIMRFSNDALADSDSVTQWAFPNRILNAAKWVAQQPANVYFVQITSFGCGPDAFLTAEIKQILQAKGKNCTLLKVDDVNNIGSLKLRIRSLLESYKSSQKPADIPEKRTPRFEKKDKHRKVIAPYFAECYSEMLPSIFKLMGIELENLPPSNLESNDYGLQYANNEICYPATLVVGDIMKALKSGKYNPDDIAIAITQTGGQCRATNYISIIKKAILAGGYDNIPVVSVSFGSGIINEQPGFELKWSRCIVSALYSMLYVDVLSKLYYPAAVRELEKGSAKKIRDKYLDLAKPLIEKRQHKQLFPLVEQAITEFSSIMDFDKEAPAVGVVGEIYVKYNSFSHKNVIDWLIEQGIEVVAPSIYNFFICEFVNFQIKKELHIDKLSFPLWFSNLIFKRIKNLTKKYDDLCASYPFYRNFSDLERDSLNASKIINLAAQFGEGWLIPAEISNFAENDIYNVVSLQPFGCIANHVISKGIEKRIKKTYPKMNLLFLDFDGGTSEANVLNRLHFMINGAKKGN